MDWKKSLYFSIRWWHLVWLGIIIFLVCFGSWTLANSKVRIRLKRIDYISGGCVARIGLTSNLPFRYTIEPFFAEVWQDDILFLRFQPFDGTRFINRGKETELLLVFNLEDISGAREAGLAENYSLKAIIPLTVLGITRAETFQAGFSHSGNTTSITP